MRRQAHIPEVRAELVSEIPLAAAHAHVVTVGDEVHVTAPADPVADVIVDTAAAAVAAAFDRFSGVR